MQNENLQNQGKEIKQNPTRFNEGVNRGDKNEKSFGEKNTSGSNDQVNVGSGRETGTDVNQNAQFSGGAETGQYDDEEGRQQQQQQAQQQSGESLGKEKQQTSQPGQTGQAEDEQQFQTGGANKGGQVGGAGQQAGQQPQTRPDRLQ